MDTAPAGWPRAATGETVTLGWVPDHGFALRICLELPVVGVDVVEVSPPFDHADITAALANRIALEVLSAIARRRRDVRDGTSWNPTQPLLDGR